MNYNRIYNQLIEKRKKNPLVKCNDGSIESHHIIPRSLGGTNSSDNIINLTLREHYFAHILLLKIAQRSLNDNAMYKMLSAVYIMQGKKLKFNSRLYANIRRNYGGSWVGKRHKKETRDKVRQIMTPQNSKNLRIWVCKDGYVKYILKSKLQDFLNCGYELGRCNYKPRKNCQGKRLDLV